MGANPITHPLINNFPEPDNLCIIDSMLNSLRTSHLILRLSLAFVFLWFGVDKFVHPDYWINAWVPLWFLAVLDRINLEAVKFIYLNGIFEVVLGLGLVFNIFVKGFAFLAVLFLAAVMLSTGFNEVIVRDMGLIGIALALLFWNGRKKY